MFETPSVPPRATQGDACALSETLKPLAIESDPWIFYQGSSQSEFKQSSSSKPMFAEPRKSAPLVAAAASKLDLTRESALDVATNASYLQPQ